MADKNIVMNIVIVLAVTLLFTGGLTGNAARRDFSYTLPEPSDLAGEHCDTSITFPEYLPGNQPAVMHNVIDVNGECVTRVKEFCDPLYRPPFHVQQQFGTGAGAQQYFYECAQRIIDSTQSPTEVGTRPAYRTYN